MNQEEYEKKILMLERRVDRERNGRRTSEKLLEDRSRELYELNQSLLQSNKELVKLTVAVEQSPTLVVITDPDGLVEYVNHSFCDITGYQLKDIVGKNIRFLEISDAEKALEAINLTMLENRVWKGELSSKKKNNDDFIVSLTISPIYDEDSEVTHYLYSGEDITQQKQHEDQINHLAHHDSLTGLFNRFSLEERLSQAVYLADRSSKKVGVLYLDLDRFKSVNDSLGHKAGDDLLKQTASRLKGICSRKSDIVARIGGDEFVIVLTEIVDVTFLALTAKAIVEVLSLPYEIENHEINTSASIGICVFPDDTLDVDSLLKNADIAMYHAKEGGRRNFSFFTAEMNQKIIERLQLEKDLRDALSNEAFELHYQPKICSVNKRVCGVESLIRWKHKERGFISPEIFIKIAEESGLIYELGLWIIDTAFAQLKDWQSRGIDQVTMAINISAKQLDNEHFVADLESSLKKYSIPASSIELEVTESTAMSNPENAIEKLVSVRDLGFEIAVDDFGTGYSSLAYLKMLPIQTLKLDRAFVNNLENDPNNAAICMAAISLSHDLGLKVVAEGIETHEQMVFLIDHACDILQGYHFSRPLPAGEATEFINNDHQLKSVLP